MERREREPQDSGTIIARMTHHTLGLALLVGLSASSCVPSEPESCWNHGRLKFDRVAWTAHDDQIGMLDDIAQHHLPVGMPREAVIELLGQHQQSTPEAIAYDVGCSRFFNVIFDHKGLLVRTRVGMPD